MKRVIGITGGVGAGKSTVLNILSREYQAEIILTDQVAHELMQPGTECFKQIVERFGTELLDEDGSFHKGRLGKMIFGNKEAAQAVNGIVHPAVKEAVKRRIEASERNLIVVESALLIEAGFQSLCDETWYVYVSTQERVKRLYEQRGYSEVKSYSIIYNQLSHEQFKRGSDRLIDNGSSREYTKRQVREFMAELTGEVSEGAQK
ncbi:MAG: dephospho-CoA kinase [Lachnospiraceae bacterium]|nr:dephospho-CoA kinase [Lachnospiraceae bacterium]